MTNHTALITGASGNLGSYIARELVAANYNVVMLSRSAEGLAEASKGLPADKVLTVAGNPGIARDVKRAVAVGTEKFGGIGGVILATGSWEIFGLDEDPEVAAAKFKKDFEAFSLTSFVTSYTLQQIFRSQGDGVIFHLSSHAAKKAHLPGNATYGPNKASAHFSIEQLYEAIDVPGVRVTNLVIEIVHTEKTSEALDNDENRAKAVQPKEIADFIIEHFDNLELEKEYHFQAKDGLVL